MHLFRREGRVRISQCGLDSRPYSRSSLSTTPLMRSSACGSTWSEQGVRRVNAVANLFGRRVRVDAARDDR